MAKDQKCAHVGCSCLADEDSDYCGAWCEGGEDRPEMKCDCGHAACTSAEPAKS